MGVPWELFFADNLVIIATSLEECVERVKAWKEGLESKGLHVNMTKTNSRLLGSGWISCRMCCVPYGSR